MKTMNWKGLVEGVGISALIASLVFVGLQVRQSQEIAIAETFLSILSSEIEVLNSRSAYADIWAKANNGEELTDAEAVVFADLIAGFSQKSQRSRSQLYRLGHTDAADLQSADFASFLFQHPVARKVWVTQIETRDRHRALTNGYVAPFPEEVRGYLRTLDQTQH